MDDQRAQSEPELRQTARYVPATQSPLCAEVTGEDAHTVNGHVLNLSCGGAKLLLDQSLTLQSEVIVRLKADAIAKPLQARVCWARPAKDGWWIGLAFREEIPRAQFSQLASNGYIERRRDQRIAYDASLTARWELGAEPIAVRLIDMSAGGIRIASDEPGEVGKRVLLEPPANEGPSIVAKIQWQRATDKGYELGCAFLNKSAYGNLRQQLGIQKRIISMPRLRVYSNRQLLALTLGVATVAVAGFAFAAPEATQVIESWFRGAR